MSAQKISCLACGGALMMCSLPVHCTKESAGWSVTLRYYACLRCGKYFASTSEVGSHTKVRLPSGQKVEIIHGEPYRTHQPVAYASDEERQHTEQAYWKGIKL